MYAKILISYTDYYVKTINYQTAVFTKLHLCNNYQTVVNVYLIIPHKMM